jgi:hypothetical protein
MEADERQGHHQKRSSQCIATPGSCLAATLLGSILRMRLPSNGWSGYHRRSRGETKMHCVKLMGKRLMARDFDRQVAEI